MKQTLPILIRYGGASKSVFEMNETEWQAASLSIVQRAKEKAFYKGLPIYYSEKGKLFAEYPDGRKAEVKKMNHGITQRVRHSRSQRNW